MRSGMSAFGMWCATAAGITASTFGDDWCGQSLSPEEAAKAELLRLSRALEGRGGVAGSGAFIPLVVHIVRKSDGSGGIDPADVLDTIAATNETFAEAGMFFCQLGQPVFINSDAFYFNVDTQAEIDELRTTAVVPGAINVYFTPHLAVGALQLCGISSFTFSPVQGIVMRNSCTAETGNLSTFAHELGHYFNLYHTHETAFGKECVSGSNCVTAGDQICDTPADPTLGDANVNQGCLYVGNAPPPCAGDGPYAPDVSNLMSYAPDDCTNAFSSLQRERMVATLFNLRPELALPACPSATFSPSVGMAMWSVSPQNGQGFGNSLQTAWSLDGRFLAFTTGAPNLVLGAGGEAFDVIVRDQTTSALELVSVNAAGEAADDWSGSPSLSGDGRYVAFTSHASNLVAGVSGGLISHIYRRDRLTGEIVLVSRSTAGDPGDDASALSVISADGRYVAYVSFATNLVADDTNRATDIFRTDLQTGETIRVSVSTAGAQGDANSGGFANSPIDMTPDGMAIAFPSNASNFSDVDAPGSDVFVHEVAAGTTTCVSLDQNGGPADGDSFAPVISFDGSLVAFWGSATDLVPGDSNNASDVFVHDRARGATSRVSVNTAGAQANGFSSAPSISADGRYVAFASNAKNLDPADTNTLHDIYVRDRLLGKTWLASPRGAAIGGGPALEPRMSRDGSAVAFYSAATNFVPNDLNGAIDVFGYERPVAVGDLNDDGAIDAADLGLLIATWGACPGAGFPCQADFDESGDVDGTDLGTLLAAWTGAE
jgi:Tol biopolymer transport system component